MKRKLVSRIAAAMAFAGLAAAVSACGSGNNNNNNGLVNGALSGLIASGSGACAPLGPTIVFQGTGKIDSANIYAGGNTGAGQLYIQTASSQPSGSYYFGRVGSDGMIGMNAQMSGSGIANINGFFQFNQTSWNVLMSQLGGSSYGGTTGYPSTYPTSTIPAGTSNICLTAMSINLGYAPNYNQQYGPFQEVLYGGSITLMLQTPQGQIPANIPF